MKAKEVKKSYSHRRKLNQLKAGLKSPE